MQYNPSYVMIYSSISIIIYLLTTYEATTIKFVLTTYFEQLKIKCQSSSFFLDFLKEKKSQHFIHILKYYLFFAGKPKHFSLVPLVNF